MSSRDKVIILPKLTMTNLQCLLIFLLLLNFSGGAHSVFRSCKDIYSSNHSSPNGTYTVHNKENKPFKVYCEFHDKFGYTYISRHAGVAVNIDDLLTSEKHVKVRHVLQNGTQIETILENIRLYKNLSLGIFYNRHIGYALPINYANLAPYLYVGFLPITKASYTNIQGYRAANTDFMFQNCDSNPNSYFVFYFNPQQKANLGYGSGFIPSGFMTSWVTYGTAIPTGDYMPPEFYFDYEIHMGGCGGYVFRHQQDNQDNQDGAALGLRFDEYDPCVCSPCQNGGSCRSTSDTQFFCDCVAGYAGDTCGKHI